MKGARRWKDLLMVENGVTGKRGSIVQGSSCADCCNILNTTSNSIIDMNKDIGCSVGISTFYLAKAFPSVEKLDAYDLSPYFLAVAKYRQNVVLDESFIAQEDKQLLWPHLSNFPASSISKIRWLHSNAENMKDAASESYDLMVLSSVLHELPQVGQRTTKQYDF